MWSVVQLSGGGGDSSDVTRQVPTSRTKHAMCISQDGYFYLLGGKSANLPLKDLWRFDPVNNQWTEVHSKGGPRPPSLQEHTVVSWKSKLFVFGGEIGFASTGEAPLWIYDIGTGIWRKHYARGPQPSGRRGHSCVVYNGSMHLYGGYQDLRGSSSELWSFNLDAEQWVLVSSRGPGYSSGEVPPARHDHSAVVHDGCMWVYGGMTDLQARSDFWRYDFVNQHWSRIKIARNRGPGEVHSHAAVVANLHMYVFGGEKSGKPNNDLWRYQFPTDTWEKVQAEGVLPHPRCRHVALPNPQLDKWADRVSECLRPKSSPADTGSTLSILRPPKSMSMIFGSDRTSSRLNRLKVHPVSKLCGTGTGSDEEEVDEVRAYLNAYSNAAGNRSLKDKLSTSRLVRSISSGNYNITNFKHEEIRNLLEDTPPLSRPNLHKSQSSEVVLDSDSDPSTPVHHRTIRKIRPLSEIIPPSHQNQVRQTRESVMPGRLSPPPPSGRSRRLTMSQSLTFNRPSPGNCCSPTSPDSISSGCRQHNPCENNTTSGSESEDAVAHQQGTTKYGPLTHISDLDSDETDGESGVCLSRRRETLLDEVRRTTSAGVTPTGDFVKLRSNRYTSFSTLSELMNTSSTASDQLPHSMSHCSGYYSFVEDDPELQRDIASFLNSSRSTYHNGKRIRPSTYAGPSSSEVMELKEVRAQAAQPGIQVIKERAKSWDRVSQRRQSETRLSRQIQAIKEESIHGSPSRVPTSLANENAIINTNSDNNNSNSNESPQSWPSPTRKKVEQHNWQLCLYVFGGQEGSTPGMYRQPMAIWKLYI